VVGVYSTALFVSCMVCHGELYRLRPDPRHLTGFYLLISAGGAAGGLFVAAAPWFFRGYYELHTGVLLCGLLYWLARRADSASARDWRWTAWVLPVLLAVGFDRALGSMVGDASVSAGFLTAGRVVVWLLLAGWIVLIAVWSRSAAREWRRPALGWLFVGFAVLAATLWLQRERSGDAILAVSRNFYGQLRVFQAQIDGIGPFRGLFHGRITHGAQMMDPLKQQIPTMYFSEQSGIGVATRALPPGPRNIGVIGLGVGTLAAYARAGDSLRFYEIDPEVETFARKWFRFLSQCPGAVEVALGDARLTMEREAPRNYDLFVLDAFSGDAIPVHLLTREAFALYERHLAANGVIAVHISNQYLNLEPVLRRMAHELGYASAAIYNNGSPDEPWVRPSGWMLLSRDQAWMNSEAIQGPARAIVYQSKEVPLWTDDFASLLQIVR
jgi:hypothetical protein